MLYRYRHEMFATKYYLLTYLLTSVSIAFLFSSAAITCFALSAFYNCCHVVNKDEYITT